MSLAAMLWSSRTALSVTATRATSTSAFVTNSPTFQHQHQQQKYSTSSIRPNSNWSSILFSSSSSSSTQPSPPQEEEVNPTHIEGTDLRVLSYPHPSLRAPNVDITPEELSHPNDDKKIPSPISTLAKEMFLVMYATKGVGLAAPQVGINKRLMVYNPTGDSKKWLDEMVMVNPKIVTYSEATDVETEGCLSFPGMNGDVQRSKWIKVEALNLKGKKVKKKFKGWEARIFQHEYDHLDGVLYPDRLEEESLGEVRGRLDELIEEFGEGGAL